MKAKAVTKRSSILGLQVPPAISTGDDPVNIENNKKIKKKEKKKTKLKKGKKSILKPDFKILKSIFDFFDFFILNLFL